MSLPPLLDVPISHLTYWGPSPRHCCNLLVFECVNLDHVLLGNVRN